MNVVIGIDPHKASHTAVAIDESEDELSSVKVRATRRQVDQLVSWAEQPLRLPSAGLSRGQRRARPAADADFRVGVMRASVAIRPAWAIAGSARRSVHRVLLLASRGWARALGVGLPHCCDRPRLPGRVSG